VQLTLAVEGFSVLTAANKVRFAAIVETITERRLGDAYPLADRKLVSTVAATSRSRRGPRLGVRFRRSTPNQLGVGMNMQFFSVQASVIAFQQTDTTTGRQVLLDLITAAANEAIDNLGLESQLPAVLASHASITTVELVSNEDGGGSGNSDYTTYYVVAGALLTVLVVVLFVYRTWSLRKRQELLDAAMLRLHDPDAWLEQRVAGVDPSHAPVRNLPHPGANRSRVPSVGDVFGRPAGRINSANQKSLPQASLHPWGRSNVSLPRRALPPDPFREPKVNRSVESTSLDLARHNHRHV
jgi:hypothetical protein